MNELSPNYLPYILLKKRAEMYSNIAESGFCPLKKVSFHFSDTYAGWVDVTVSIDGEEVAKARLSNVLSSDPVGEMIDWVEACTNNHSNYCFPFGEGTDYIFHYEDLLYSPIQRKKDGKKLDTGIFYLFIKRIEGIQFEYALCDTKVFVKSFYDAILDFAKRQEANQNIVDDWAGDLYGDGREKYSEEDKQKVRRRMLDNMRSLIIEEYIKRNRK